MVLSEQDGFIWWLYCNNVYPEKWPVLYVTDIKA